MFPTQALGNKTIVGKVLLALFIAGVMTFVIQAVPLSFRKLLIEPPVLTGPELGALEILVGFFNSVIVTAICLFLLRRPALYIAVTAVVAQIVWIEWAYSFRQGGETVALAILRYTEHLGVILGATAIVIVVNRVTKNKAVQS